MGNGSWPPFQPGHRLSERHGANSPRRVQELVDRHMPGLLDAAPWLADDAFADALGRYLRAEARARLAHQAVAQVATTQGVGAVPRYLWSVAASNDRLAAQLAARLGLDPAGKAALMRDASLAHHFAGEDALEAIRAEGRRLIAARATELEHARAPETPGEAQ